MRISSLSLALSGLASAVSALDAIEVLGNKFFKKDGSQFFLKGVAYQLRPQDPLIDTEQCQRDASLMKELGVNSIRVYHVDASANHDGCMKAFDDAGIYLLIDLDTFGTYVISTDLHWNQTQYDSYAAVMDTFHNYDNVLGFFVGNENIAKKEDSIAAPFIKAAARDMKAYRDKKNYRKIPIGYSAADIVELRPMLQNYLACGGDSADIIDFFALNSYSWCDPADYNTSTYDKLEEYAKDYPVPIFFSETGCNTPGPRLFADQDAVFGKDMIHDWSGSIIYEWIEEENHYGLISYGPSGGDTSNTAVEGGFTRQGTPTPVSPDFNNLKSKWATITPSGVHKSDVDPKTLTTPACPTSTNGGWWAIEGNVRLPTLGETMAGTFTAVPSATSDSQPQTTGGGGGGQDDSKNDGKGQDKGQDKGKGKNAASKDMQITVLGSSIAAVILFAAVAL
ncbi:Glycolipid anchored surface protein GAS1 [Akanthomyces lecanii RCEF 1005]|uniref:1,3-beta-glucanosyltransferase n=1 Tax=Akanthomyces lecanii RCEF 1005 TaxID=1081108 RepID=A0A162K8R2_CORDF|nr:Glycolipid anchored surface protein GAS1 [Akanthomyces lecanii RCEF 1005]